MITYIEDEEYRTVKKCDLKDFNFFWPCKLRVIYFTDNELERLEHLIAVINKDREKKRRHLLTWDEINKLFWDDIDTLIKLAGCDAETFKELKEKRGGEELKQEFIRKRNLERDGK